MVFEFFSRYGEIETFSAPKIIKDREYNAELAHFNIMYKDEESALKAY